MMAKNLNMVQLRAETPASHADPTVSVSSLCTLYVTYVHVLPVVSFSVLFSEPKKGLFVPGLGFLDTLAT